MDRNRLRSRRGIVHRIKAIWTSLERREPGRRFEGFHREQRNEPTVVRAAFLGAAFVCFATGVVFALIPGPAILFFALGGALLATQSLRVARWLDRFEVWARNALASVRRGWRRRS